MGHCQILYTLARLILIVEMNYWFLFAKKSKIPLSVCLSHHNFSDGWTRVILLGVLSFTEHCHTQVYEDDLKNKDTLKNEDNLKNEDALKNEKQYHRRRQTLK